MSRRREMWWYFKCVPCIPVNSIEHSTAVHFIAYLFFSYIQLSKILRSSQSSVSRTQSQNKNGKYTNYVGVKYLGNLATDCTQTHVHVLVHRSRCICVCICSNGKRMRDPHAKIFSGINLFCGEKSSVSHCVHMLTETFWKYIFCDNFCEGEH